jgi:hypothetical protein
MKPSQSQHTNTNLKGTLSGLPKLLFDPSKQRSNILEVERALNYFVQSNYPSLSDCIATRDLEELQIFCRTSFDWLIKSSGAPPLQTCDQICHCCSKFLFFFLVFCRL